MINTPSSARLFLLRYAPHVAFVAAYVFLDYVSFIQPMHGLNITPWNPPPALGLVYWLRYGKSGAIGWFCALLVGDWLIRGFPAGWLPTIALSACLVIGYGCIGETLRRRFSIGRIFGNRQELLAWLAIVVIGTLLNAIVYILLLYVAGLIPKAEWAAAMFRYWIGDVVGVTITMPIFWMLATSQGRRRLRTIARSWETFGYCCVMLALVWFIFGFLRTAYFNHFYFLFLPIVWAAARHGLAGASLVSFVLQLGIIGAVTTIPGIDIPFFELQLLLSALAFGCFFIGVVVDEQKQIAEELKQTLRLAAAGEMAAALAHELNQPLTALLAYGKACDELLARNDTGEVFRNAIRRMIVESNRAASVVRRLRDFFQTGAMQLQSVEVSMMVEAVTAPFAERLQKHRVTLKIDPIPAITVKVDRLQIELVLRNLLDNAFDAVLTQPLGNRNIGLSTHFLDGGRVVMSITDSGPGVSDNMIDRLFEPFISSKSSGMGLGLALSRTIVEAHGGNLWAEIGDHGVFKFVLPFVESTKNDVK
jgi:two-component system sensor kinase FixL